MKIRQKDIKRFIKTLNKSLESHEDGKVYILDRSGHLLRIESCSSGCYIKIDGSDNQFAVQGSFSLECSGESGTAFEGTGVNKSFFEFMAKETNVEWGLSLISGGGNDTPGYIKTSYSENSVDNVFRNGYDTLYHNHGDGYENAEHLYDFVDICSHPSLTDINNMSEAIKNGYQRFYIYNELQKKTKKAYNEYFSKSKTMEERARELGYNISGSF